MNRLGKTFHVDFKTKEYYTESREYQDATSEFEKLFKVAVRFNSFESHWILDELQAGGDENHALECLRDIIAENKGA